MPPRRSSSDPGRSRGGRAGRSDRDGGARGGSARGGGARGGDGRGGRDGRPGGDARGAGRAGGRTGRPAPRTRPAETEREREERAGQEHGRKAGWGSVARKGAGRLGRKGSGGGAAEAFREAAGRPDWEPDRWVDEGVDAEGLRASAGGAVGRGRGRGADQRRGRADTAPGRRRATEGSAADQPQTRGRRRAADRAAPRRRPGPAAADDASWSLEADLTRAVGAARAEKLGERVAEAARAFDRDRFDEARRLLKPLAEQAPQSAAVRELYGVALYRMGRWKDAARELEAFRGLTASVEQHPVLADCYRALHRYQKVRELWEELREASPGAALVAEGRIVAAGALADQGRLDDAIRLLEASPRPSGKAKPHHLRVAYALADLHERAGDIPRARELFARVAVSDEHFADVAARLAALD
jgi:thioredoxin-like negative regulator of GroEL